MDRAAPAPAAGAGVPVLSDGYGPLRADEKLDHVEQDIEHARDQAEDAGILDDPDEPKFYETGELSDIDDQTIAPPG